MELSNSSYSCTQLNNIITTENGFITQHSGSLGYLNNGIEYYFVEVTSKSGVQYGIWAHGSGIQQFYSSFLHILNRVKNWNHGLRLWQ
jgi:hypothetical protein